MRKVDPAVETCRLSRGLKRTADAARLGPITLFAGRETAGRQSASLRGHRVRDQRAPAAAVRLLPSADGVPPAARVPPPGVDGIPPPARVLPPPADGVPSAARVPPPPADGIPPAVRVPPPGVDGVPPPARVPPLPVDGLPPEAGGPPPPADGLSPPVNRLPPVARRSVIGARQKYRSSEALSSPRGRRRAQIAPPRGRSASGLWPGAPSSCFGEKVPASGRGVELAVRFSGVSDLPRSPLRRAPAPSSA